MPDHSMAALRAALESIVPFHMAEMGRRRLTSGNLMAIASRAGKGFSHLGDALMFPSKDSGRTLSAEAQAINALAEGIAAAELLEPGEGARILDRIAPAAVEDAGQDRMVSDGSGCARNETERNGTEATHGDQPND